MNFIEGLFFLLPGFLAACTGVIAYTKWGALAASITVPIVFVGTASLIWGPAVYRAFRGDDDDIRPN